MDAQELWGGLDEAWREAFRQGWDAVRGGNIGVGAVAATAAGEIFGSSLAHAEMNVLARLGLRKHRNLVLTTTLQPCLQCAGAIRLARIGTVRFAGHDVYWDGYHDFGKLAVREKQRQRRPARRLGPRGDELGVFGLLMSRFRLGNPRLSDQGFEAALRDMGEGPVLDLAYRIEDGGELQDLMAVDVDQALTALWPRLQALTA